MKRFLSVVLTLVMLVTLTASAEQTEPSFKRLSDPALRSYLESGIYEGLVSTLDSDEYFVENVSSIYISQEYLDELAYNSQANVFFGYTLEDLDAQFIGQKYVFTLGKDGQTTVEPFEAYNDIYSQVLRNVAIGTGVILVCVTVSVVTAGAAVPATSIIFAMAAKTGTVCALSGAALGGLSAGIVTGIQTGDMDMAMRSALITGSEGFKWGAITGAIAGGTITRNAINIASLKGAALSGLTMKEAASIQSETNWPIDVIKNFQSIDQYQICLDAGLFTTIINNKAALVRKIDLNMIDEFGRTNLQRMQEGLAALDPTGISYELHHIGQNPDSTLAILTKAEHMQNGNNSIWHELGSTSKINRTSFDKQREAFWIEMAKVSTREQ